MPVSPAGAVAVLLIQAAASWFMTGLTWTMQVLNYPLLAMVNPSDVPAGAGTVARPGSRPPEAAS